MSSTLRATLVANAGLLLKYAGTTLLLDDIYENEQYGFSSLAPDVWQKYSQVYNHSRRLVPCCLLTNTE